MNSFQICQLIIIRVDAYKKEQTRITPINNLERAEFDKVGLMLLISRRNQAMHFTLEFNFFFILGVIEGGECVSFTIHPAGTEMERENGGWWNGYLTLYGAYHFARRVLPLRNRILTSCLAEGETEKGKKAQTVGFGWGWMRGPWLCACGYN